MQYPTLLLSRDSDTLKISLYRCLSLLQNHMMIHNSLILLSQDPSRSGDRQTGKLKSGEPWLHEELQLMYMRCIRGTSTLEYQLFSYHSLCVCVCVYYLHSFKILFQCYTIKEPLKQEYAGFRKCWFHCLQLAGNVPALSVLSIWR